MFINVTISPNTQQSENLLVRGKKMYLTIHLKRAKCNCNNYPVSSVLLALGTGSSDELYPIQGNQSSGKYSIQYSLTRESCLGIFQMIMIWFKLCLTCPIGGLKEHIIPQVSLKLMEIPPHWSVEMKLHISQSIYCRFIKEKRKFLKTWNKYKKAAQTGRQDSTHKPSF